MITSWHLFTVLNIHSLHKQYCYSNKNSKKWAVFIPGNGIGYHTTTINHNCHRRMIWNPCEKQKLCLIGLRLINATWNNFQFELSPFHMSHSYFAFTEGALLTPYNLWIMHILHTVSFNAIINYFNALPVCLIYGCHVNIITGMIHVIVVYSIG